MDSIKQLVDYFLHIDKYLAQITASFGLWSYAILFLIVFCETGLVVTPFLPGDSLLFAAGALTATTPLQIGWMMLVLTGAAILGDTVNYLMGSWFGESLIQRKSRLVKQEHIERTHRFFKRHGKKTIILARFVPIVRTFAPFVAGMGQMNYLQFMIYNVVGALLWVGLLVPAGRLFGNLPIVKQYFSLVIVAIIVISVLPIAYEVCRGYLDRRRSADAQAVLGEDDRMSECQITPPDCEATIDSMKNPVVSRK